MASVYPLRLRQYDECFKLLEECVKASAAAMPQKPAAAAKAQHGDSRASLERIVATSATNALAPAANAPADVDAPRPAKANGASTNGTVNGATTSKARSTSRPTCVKSGSPVHATPQDLAGLLPPSGVQKRLEATATTAKQPSVRPRPAGIASAPEAACLGNHGPDVASQAEAAAAAHELAVVPKQHRAVMAPLQQKAPPAKPQPPVPSATASDGAATSDAAVPQRVAKRPRVDSVRVATNAASGLGTAKAPVAGSKHNPLELKQRLEALRQKAAALEQKTSVLPKQAAALPPKQATVVSQRTALPAGAQEEQAKVASAAAGTKVGLAPSAKVAPAKGTSVVARTANAGVAAVPLAAALSALAAAPSAPAATTAEPAVAAAAAAADTAESLPVAPASKAPRPAPTAAGAEFEDDAAAAAAAARAAVTARVTAARVAKAAAAAATAATLAAPAATAEEASAPLPCAPAAAPPSSTLAACPQALAHEEPADEDDDMDDMDLMAGLQSALGGEPEAPSEEQAAASAEPPPTEAEAALIAGALFGDLDEDGGEEASVAVQEEVEAEPPVDEAFDGDMSADMQWYAQVSSEGEAEDLDLVEVEGDEEEEEDYDPFSTEPVA